MHDKIDVLIIGSGASGVTVAWSLADTNMRIVCLEQGDWVRPNHDPSNRRDWESHRYGDRRGGAVCRGNVPKAGWYAVGNRVGSGSGGRTRHQEHGCPSGVSAGIAETKPSDGSSQTPDPR